MTASLEPKGEGFLQLSAWPPARPPACTPPNPTSSMAIDPCQQRHCVPGKGKQIHLVASDNHPAPVGTGRGKLIVCSQRLDIVNVFAIDGAR